MTFLEDLDFTNNLAVMLHRIQNMRDKIPALDEQGIQVHRTEDQRHKLKTKLMCIDTR